MRISRPKKIVIAVTAIAALGGGSALAYWTQGGTGTGNATAGTTTGVTVHQDLATDSSVGALYPGQGPVPLSGTFTSPNSGPVTVASVTATVTVLGVDPFTPSVARPSCTASNFQIAGTSGPYIVTASPVVTWSGLTVELLNTALNQDNCKGRAITINYTANAL